MKKEPGYTDAEIEQRAADMVRRSFTMPYKSRKDLVGKTDRAKAMRRTKLKRAIEKVRQATQHDLETGTQPQSRFGQAAIAIA